MKIVLLSGSSAVGKSSVLRWLLPMVNKNESNASVCKIDCFDNGEKPREELKSNYVLGVSGDICPDHFLVSNMPDLIKWSKNNGSETLFIETAGLCHRCSPATKKMISGCIVDCTASTKAPQSLGPMLLYADFIVVSKIDMVSQAEREIIFYKLKKLNKNAKIFAVDNLAGYGIEPLYDYIKSCDTSDDFECDILRHTMPMGVCSYCVGEKRVGEQYQQGVSATIEF